MPRSCSQRIRVGTLEGWLWVQQCSCWLAGMSVAKPAKLMSKGPGVQAWMSSQKDARGIVAMKNCKRTCSRVTHAETCGQHQDRG